MASDFRAKERDQVNPRFFMDELWRLYFAAFKCVLVFVASLLRTLSLTILFLAQILDWGFCTFEEFVSNWQPVRPEIFDTEDRDG